SCSDRVPVPRVGEQAPISFLASLPRPYSATPSPVDTIRERSPGAWEVRAFTGRDGQGRSAPVSRTVLGG
ncbi:MAG: hypothetical protein ACYDES_05210, partial [Acidimicrobiales bacterium]